MTDLNFQELLLRELDRSASLRKRSDEDEAFRERRIRLRAWQAGRLARTHADLLVSPRFHEAAVFFLTDLYGTFPDSAPDYPVLWASTSGRHAPFGSVIPMQAA